jgi:hypothetical protein
MEASKAEDRGKQLALDRACDYLSFADVVALRVAFGDKDLGLSSEVLTINDFADFLSKAEADGAGEEERATDDNLFELPNVGKCVSWNEGLQSGNQLSLLGKQDADAKGYLIALIMITHWALAPRAKTLTVSKQFFRKYWKGKLIGEENREISGTTQEGEDSEARNTAGIVWRVWREMNAVVAYIRQNFRRVRLVLDDDTDQTIDHDTFLRKFCAALPETVVESFKETHDSLHFVDGGGLVDSEKSRSTTPRANMLEELEVHLKDSDRDLPLITLLQSATSGSLKCFTMRLCGKVTLCRSDFGLGGADHLESLCLARDDRRYEEIEVGDSLSPKLRKLTLEDCFFINAHRLIRDPPPLQELTLSCRVAPIGLFGQDIMPFVVAFEGTLRRLILSDHGCCFQGDLLLSAPHLQHADLSGCMMLRSLALRAPQLSTLLLGECFSLDSLELETGCLHSLDLTDCVSLERADLSKCPSSIEVSRSSKERPHLIISNE